MTMTPTVEEIIARAIAADLDRDFSAWAERWTFPGGVYSDAPDPPKNRYTSSPERCSVKIVAALDAAGFVIAPKEATEEMKLAGIGIFWDAPAGKIYRAMIEARPQSPSGGEP